MNTPAKRLAAIKKAIKSPGFKLGARCCFCQGTVMDNICAVILRLNWEQPEDKQKMQQFFCHPACFEKVTKEKIDVWEDRPAAH